MAGDPPQQMVGYLPASHCGIPVSPSMETEGFINPKFAFLRIVYYNYNVRFTQDGQEATSRGAVPDFKRGRFPGLF